jgi:hypothetical protein
MRLDPTNLPDRLASLRLPVRIKKAKTYLLINALRRLARLRQSTIA